MNASEVYTALESAVLPMMRHYQTDLTTHDRNAITDSTPFLHWAHDSGTVIVFLLSADDSRLPKPGDRVPYLFGTADRHHIVSEVRNMAEYYCRPCNASPRLVHHFDGKRLRRIDDTKALSIARDYVRQVESVWQRKERGAVA